MTNKPERIINHHSAIDRLALPEQFDAINNGHKNRIWGYNQDGSKIHAQPSSLLLYGQYHYVIEPTGERKQYREDWEIAWHSGNWDINCSSIAILTIGNFEIQEPTEAQYNELAKLHAELQKKHGIPTEKIELHKDIKTTLCPGKNFNLEIILNKMSEDDMPDEVKWCERNSIARPERLYEGITRYEVMVMMNRLYNLIRSEK